MSTLRVIHDPGPPTLPRRVGDRLLEAILLLAILLFAFKALAGQNAEPQGVPPTPAAAAMRYHECPFCHQVFAVTVEKDRILFTDHRYIRLAMSATAYYETCTVTYFKHIGEAILAFRRVSDGRIVETTPGEKP